MKIKVKGWTRLSGLLFAFLITANLYAQDVEFTVNHLVPGSLDSEILQELSAQGIDNTLVTKLTVVSGPDAYLVFGDCRFIVNVFPSLAELDLTSAFFEENKLPEPNAETGVFSGFASLERVLLPDALTQVSSFSFEGGTALNRINMPAQLNNIEESAFSGCFQLSILKFGKVAPLVEQDAFASAYDAPLVFALAESEVDWTAGVGVSPNFPANVRFVYEKDLAGDTTVCRNSTLQLINNIPDATDVSWMKNQELIAGETSTTLILSSVGEGDSGEYAMAYTYNGTADTLTVTVLVEASTCAVISVMPSSAYLDRYNENERSIQLSATISPVPNDPITVLWSSSNEEVATVNENGFVTVILENDIQAVITASIQEEPEKTGKSSIRVVNSTALRNSIADADSKEEADYLPDPWTAMMTALAAANATLENVIAETAIQSEIDKATTDLNTAIEGLAVAIESFTLNRQELLICQDGEPQQLTAVFIPAESEQPVVWSSSDETVAVVDSEGKVSPVGIGSAIVTAITNDSRGEHTATCEVTVGIKPGAIVVQKWDNTLIVNNNPQTNGGFSFSATEYQWYENGSPIVGATGQYYSAGDNSTDKLNSSSSYTVSLMTVEGERLFTCPAAFNISQNLSIAAYPNPVSAGQKITVAVELPSEKLTGTTIQVVNLSGRVVQKAPIMNTITEMTMPNESGNYVLQIKTNSGTSKVFKILVK